MMVAQVVVKFSLIFTFGTIILSVLGVIKKILPKNSSISPFSLAEYGFDDQKNTNFAAL